ncbi:MAG TPA: glycosyltransferase family 2 protein [Syntrophales bacterium]|nr:glycosyltransferase family 2 protein [Syntrophales bacterium]
MEKDRVAVVIPAFNHEGKVAQVVREALKLQLPLFVVDDGSTDSTYDRIKNIPSITIIRHNINRGKGAAIMTGFAAAAPLADWAVTMDADGQHHPEDTLELIKAVPSGQRPIIVGCREGMEHRHVPWKSRFGRAFSNFWVRASGGPAIRDTQSGFRLYPLPESMHLGVRARRFQFEVEILVRANWHGMPVMETPVQVTYEADDQRVSHYRGFVDFCRNAAAFSRLIFTRLCVLPFLKPPSYVKRD